MLIYCITFPNGKQYVGQTKRKFNIRINQHRMDMRRVKSCLYNAFKKYGFNNVEWDILEDNIETKEDLNNKEIFWIEKLKTLAPNGYNIQRGGTYNYNKTRRVVSEEVKLKLSNKMKEHWKTHKHPHLGRRMSYEHLQKMRVSKITHIYLIWDMMNNFYRVDNLRKFVEEKGLKLSSFKRAICANRIFMGYAGISYRKEFV